MLLPIAAAAALFAAYRWNKMKQARELEALLPTTPVAPAVPPGYAPPARPTSIQGIAKVIAAKQPLQPMTALGNRIAPGTGGLFTGTLAKIFGAGTTTADVPPSRIPSSAYGTGGGTTPPPATPGGSISATGELKFKL